MDNKTEYSSSEVNESIWRGIMRLADCFNEVGKSNCDLPNRLPLSQLRVVGVIYERHPSGVMLKDIADELKLTPGAVSQTVDILVRENIVERTVSPTDRRAILLRPTAQGLILKDEHYKRINTVLTEITRDIAPEDMATFRRVLNSLYEQMSKINKQKNQ